MRIAFHAPMKAPGDPVPSGEGRMAGLFMRALEEAGFTPELASSFRAYEGRGDGRRQEILAEGGAVEAERVLAKFRALPEAGRPRLWFTYHLYHKAPDYLGPVVAAGLGIPYVVAEASHAPKQANGPWSAGYRAAETAIRSAERIYCLNPVDRACLEPLAKPGALRDLSPFIDTAPFRATDKAGARAELAALHGLDPDKPLLLAVAMMRDDQKLRSYAVLAEALGALDGREWQVLLVGDGPAAGDVRRLFAAFGNRVNFAGRLDGDDLKRAYAGADIYAWPSVKEAFGLAFIEAAASGLAVVAGRSGGIDHIVEDGRTGFVVEAGDAAAMAARLSRLLDEPDLVDRMGRAGAERARAVNDVAPAATLLRADLATLLERRSDA